MYTPTRTSTLAPLRLSGLPVLGLLAAACGSGADPSTGARFSDAALVADFADRVVVATYADLDARAAELATAVDALAAAPDATRLAAAQTAWRAARTPWERGEAFLFGPVDAFGYDPAMDSWPVNRIDLDAVLASADPFTPAYVRNLQETQKGFHTVEYLLFGASTPRTAGSLGARERDYLVAIAHELAAVAAALHTSWTAGVEGNAPYRDVFATAGQPGNTAYPSLAAAAEEILGGMAEICDEVANGKLAGPFDAHDPELVESQFGFNSLEDFANNLRGVENAYRGGVSDATRGRGLGDVVVARDPALDARVRAELGAALAALAAIPPPFRTAITTPTAYPAIEAAQDAIRTLHATLRGDVAAAVLE